MNQSNKATIWAKENLFRTSKDTIITFVVGGFFLYLTYLFINYVFFQAEWEINRVNLRLLMIGRYPQEHEIRLVIFCISFIVMLGLIAGLIEQSGIAKQRVKPLSLTKRTLDYLKRFWLLAAVIVLLLIWAGTINPIFVVIAIVFSGMLAKLIGKQLTNFVPEEYRKYIYIFALLLPAIALLFVFSPLEKVDDLGGFLLNVIVAIGAIITCFPIGLAMALGRRSKK